MRDARPRTPSSRRRTPQQRRAVGLVPLLALALVGAGAAVPATASAPTDPPVVTAAAGGQLVVYGDVWSVVGHPLPVRAYMRGSTGTVELRRGGTVLAAAPLVDGVAEVVPAGLPVGDHSVEVHYVDDAGRDVARDVVTVHVLADGPLVVQGAQPGVGPRTGYTTGDAYLVVVGSGFTSDMTATVDGRAAAVNLVDDTTALLQPEDTDVLGPVEVVLTATRADGTVRAVAEYVYVPDVVTTVPARVLDKAALTEHWCFAPSEDVVHPYAEGVFVNVTAAAPTGAGYAVVYPDLGRGGAAASGVEHSTVNFEPGVDTANSAYVALGADGQICIDRAGGPAQRLIVDVTGYTFHGSGLVPVPSARVLDTRRGGTGSVTGPVQPRTQYTVQVAGRNGVPAHARAVLVNATTTQVTSNGNLRVFPADQSAPDTSTVNYVAGRDKANTTLVQLSDGKLSFWSDSSGTAEVVLDVLGYTTSESTVTAAPRPTRVVDTRAPSRVGPLDGPLPARQAVTLPLADVAPVPAGATAVVLNVTSIDPKGVGNLRVFPAPEGDGPLLPPEISTVNYVTGRAVPNQVVVELPASGRIALWSDTASGPVDVAVDVVGWVTGPTAGR